MLRFTKTLLFALFSLLALPLAADELMQQLAHCEENRDALQRLACYDTLVSEWRKQEVQSLLQGAQPTLLTQPAPEVLNSTLQITGDDGFRLSVQALLAMIKVAKLDEGGGIKILGWQELDKSNYILWLQLRGRTGLTIQYYAKSKSQAEAVSVLEAVIMQGKHIDPGMFIMNIAAMGPE